MAGRFRGAGLQPGDRLLWSTGSTVTGLVAHVAALRAGLVVVPANIAYTDRELAHIVTDVRPQAAVVEGSQRQEAVHEMSGDSGLVVVGPDVGLPEGDEGRLDAAEPDDPALILYTSGTTGAPKGAVLRHRNLLAGAESVRLAWRWSDADRLVHALPVFHAHGLCVGIYGTLLAGSSAVLLPKFDPAAVIDAAHQVGATLFFGVPTMYHRLVALGPRRRPSGPPALRVGLGPHVRRAAPGLDVALGSTVLERYGMTETLMDLSNPYEGSRRPGTVGFPLPGSKRI